MIEVNRVTLGYRQRHGVKEVLRDLSFDWDKGDLLCILGANGAERRRCIGQCWGFCRY